MLLKGKTIEEIADLTGIDIKKVKKISDNENAEK